MIERFELAPGYRISRLINGAWQLSEGHGASDLDRRSMLRELRRLAEAGLTTFDCADIYLGVEDLLGELRRELRESGPNAPRIQIHTKYVPDLSDLRTLSRRQVGAAIDRSLRRLGVDSLDLVQFHWWDYGVRRYVEVAEWLADLQRGGKIRLLGVTNLDGPRLGEIVEAGVPLASHQVQYSLLDRRAAAGMTELCRRHGIHLLCYGAVAGGFFSLPWLGTPEPAEPLPNRSLVKYRLIIDEFGGWPLFQELLAVAAEIGRKHGVSPTNVALRWVLDRPQVAAVLVGSHGAAHLQDNLRVFDLCLDAEDHESLAAVLRRAEGPRGEPYHLERAPGSRHAAIMRTDLNREARGRPG